MTVKEELLTLVKLRAENLRDAEEEYTRTREAFLATLLFAYDEAGKKLRPTHREMAAVAQMGRTRISQLLMEARK